MLFMQMDKRLRLLTINQGEEAHIKVNSSIPITLDFNGHCITLWAVGDMVFQRTEKTEVDSEPVRIEPDDEGPMVETQPMFDDDDMTDDGGETQIEETQIQFTPSPPPFSSPVLPEHITLRKNPLSHLRELEDLQMELFGDMYSGDTQIDI